EEIDELPDWVIVELSDGNLASVSLATDAEWVLISPDGGAYDGNVAGEYIYHAPLVMPEEDAEPYFTNNDGLVAEVTIQVLPSTQLELDWSVLFDGVEVPDGETLQRHYRDSTWITFDLGDWDGDASDVQANEIGGE